MEANGSDGHACVPIYGTIAKWLRRLIRICSIITSSLRAQVRILLVSGGIHRLRFFFSLSLGISICDSTTRIVETSPSPLVVPTFEIRRSSFQIPFSGCIAREARFVLPILCNGLSPSIPNLVYGQS